MESEKAGLWRCMARGGGRLVEWRRLEGDWMVKQAFVSAREKLNI